MTAAAIQPEGRNRAGSAPVATGRVMPEALGAAGQHSQQQQAGSSGGSSTGSGARPWAGAANSPCAAVML